MLSKDSSSSIIIFRAAVSMFTVLAVAGVVNGQDIAGNETKRTMPAGTTVIDGSMLGNMTCAGNMTTSSGSMYSK